MSSEQHQVCLKAEKLLTSLAASTAEYLKCHEELASVVIYGNLLPEEKQKAGDYCLKLGLLALTGSCAITQSEKAYLGSSAKSLPPYCRELLMRVVNGERSIEWDIQQQ